jgi:hypothetical protein
MSCDVVTHGVSGAAGWGLGVAVVAVDRWVNLCSAGSTGSGHV